MATAKSRNVLQIRLSVIFCLAIIMLSSCQNEGQQNAMLPTLTPTLVDPHHHVVDVSQTNLPPAFPMQNRKIVC